MTTKKQISKKVRKPRELNWYVNLRFYDNHNKKVKDEGVRLQLGNSSIYLEEKEVQRLAAWMSKASAYLKQKEKRK